MRMCICVYKYICRYFNLLSFVVHVYFCSGVAMREWTIVCQLFSATSEAIAIAKEAERRRRPCKSGYQKKFKKKKIMLKLKFEKKRNL